MTATHDCILIATARLGMVDDVSATREEVTP